MKNKSELLMISQKIQYMNGKANKKGKVDHKKEKEKVFQLKDNFKKVFFFLIHQMLAKIRKNKYLVK